MQGQRRGLKSWPHGPRGLCGQTAKRGELGFSAPARSFRAQGSPQGSPRRARQASAAASSVTRGAGSASRKPLMPSARAAESHCSRSLRDQSVGAGGRCLWGCWGPLPVPPSVEALPHLCRGAAARACRGIRCLALVGGVRHLSNAALIPYRSGGEGWGQRTQHMPGRSHLPWEPFLPQFNKEAQSIWAQPSPMQREPSSPVKG